MAPIPDFKDTASLLLLDSIALDAHEGNIDSALVALERRIAFDRRMLVGSYGLIGGMVAAARLRRDFALLGEIVAANPGKLAPHRERLVAMTEPFALPDIRSHMARYVDAEATLIVACLPRLLEAENEPKADARQTPWEWLAIKLLYRPNATANWYTRGHLRFLQRVSEFDPADLAGYYANVTADTKEQIEALFELSVVYNWIGKILATTASGTYADYIVRLSDLMAISRLVRLQVLIAQADSPVDVADLLARDERLYDPYTARPMQSDAASQRIAVDLRAKQSQNRPGRFELVAPTARRSQARSDLK